MTAATQSAAEAGAVAGRHGLRDRLASLDQGYLVFAVVVLISVISAVTLKGFLSTSNIRLVLINAAPLGVLAVGTAIVILGKGIDLSVAAVVVIAAEGTVSFWSSSGGGEVKAMVLVAGICVLIGLLNGWLVAYVELPALFVTLGTWQFLGGLFVIRYLHSNIYRLPTDSSILSKLGTGSLIGIPRPVLVAAIVFILAALFINYTTVGKMIRAMGDNPAAGAYTGLPVRPLTALTFLVSAMLALLAGWLSLSINGTFSTFSGGSDTTLLFNAVTAAVIGGFSLTGGKGTVFGLLGGVLFVSVMVDVMRLLNLNIVQSTFVTGCVILAALAFDCWLHPRDEETARSGEL